MALLYDVETNTINYHIKKIFSDSELQPESVIRKFRITAADGKNYSANHYNLQMIIAVGFKVNSERAVQFRKWVNEIAATYTIKGWVMDEERLKRGTFLTDKYFDEQLNEFGRFVPSSVNSIRRSPIFMQQLWITTELPWQPSASTRQFRIRCTSRFTDILRQS